MQSLRPRLSALSTQLRQCRRLAQALCFILLGFTFTLATANNLKPEQAFRLKLVRTSHHYTLQWNIAHGYHLYRQHMQVKPAANSNLKLGAINWPMGIEAYNNILGSFELYTGTISIPLPLSNSQRINARSQIIVSYQGCYGTTFCYPPITKLVNLNSLQISDLNTGAQLNTNQTTKQHTMVGNRFSTMLFNQHTGINIIIFLGLGILLAFTPCVLPMIPILASIIIGQKRSSTRRAFMLSATYVLSAAAAFAAAGAITALAGNSVQTFLQNPLVSIFMALLFILLALSLFGLFELQLPAFLRERIERRNQLQQGGSYLGTAMMGVLSTLVVSPCISAPLAGALIYISLSGNVILGASSLFALGLGMGIPLLLIGTLGGKFMPKSGKFMQSIKIIFGVIMLGLAGWMVMRALPSSHNTSSANYVVTSTPQLEPLLTQAQQKKQAVIIDYYASWCIACHELEAKTFSDQHVRAKLSKIMFIRADVTANNQQTRALQRRFQVFAPPTIIFIKKNGQRVPHATIYGYVPAHVFLKSIAMIKI